MLHGALFPVPEDTCPRFLVDVEVDVSPARCREQTGYSGLRHQYRYTDLFVQGHDTVRQGLIKDTCL